MYDIFISYSRKDLNSVKQIKSGIEFETGAKCWMDMESIESGALFEDVIVAAIDSVQIVVVLLSKNSMESSRVKEEVRYAYDTQKTVIPINIDDSTLTGWFLYKFSGRDIINYNVTEQKSKMFNNLRSMIGAKGVSERVDVPQTPNVGKHFKKRQQLPYYQKDLRIAVVVQMVGLSVLILLFCWLFTTKTFSKYPLLRFEDSVLVADLFIMAYCTYNLKKYSWCKWCFLLLDVIAFVLLYSFSAKYHQIVDGTGIRWKYMSVVHRQIYLIGSMKIGLALFYSLIICIIHNLAIYVIMNSRLLWQKYKSR